MPYARRRPHLHNRRQTLQLSLDSVPIDLWLPPADEPIVIDDFPAAMSMVEWLSDGPVTEGALVLLDENRRITGVILDPPASVCVFPGMLDGPGFEVEFGNTLLVMFPPEIDAISDAERRFCYETTRKHHALQGLLLLDIIVVQDDDVRSSSFAYDRDSVWFEPFQPIGAPLEDQVPAEESVGPSVHSGPLEGASVDELPDTSTSAGTADRLGCVPEPLTEPPAELGRRRANPRTRTRRAA